MADLMALDGPRRAPASGGKPKQLVVLLHGWGANGDDLIGLAPYLAQALPEAVFVSPNAPYPCEANPMGLQWFSLADRAEERLLAGLRLAASLVDSFLDEELARQGLTDADLALVGFSQGTMLSLHVGTRRKTAPAQIVGYSGALIGGQHLAAEITSRPPTLLVHGQSDPVVPYQASEQAAALLQENGVKVDLILRPGLPHSIDEVGLGAAGQALRGAFGAGA
ncbi:MAG: prolyl oligopeptidase family serine peptidase [Pseudomonadota bacterium]